MGNIYCYEPEKLIIGIMYVKDSYYYQALEMLKNAFGEIELISEKYSFSSFSSFYDEEMGGNVWRRFVSFSSCVYPDELANIKIRTNNIEHSLSINENRQINIDPCLLSHGRFVMATTKAASFRIPLQEGIYADFSLIYARNQWHDFFWTYFDIKSSNCKAFLDEVRNRYLIQRKSWVNKTHLIRNREEYVDE